MKKEFKIWEFQDLIENESFKNWVINQEDSAFWEDFATRNTKNAQEVERARIFILSIFSINIKGKSEKEIISAYEELNLQKNKEKRQFFTQIYRIVATVLILGFGGFLSFIYFDKSNIAEEFKSVILESNSKSGLIEQINYNTLPQIITLSDGSSVLLQPNSKLSYPSEFKNDKREVFLTGEAFFEVSKNPLKPFYVYSNEVVTRVYGTSFRVIAYEGQENVEVMVKTGKVKVSKVKIGGKLDPSNSLINDEITLLPNQAARFLKKESSFEKVIQISENKEIQTELEEIEKLSFEFDDIPVAQIFKTIEDVYSIKIDYPRNKMEKCYLTTSLTDIPLPEKMKIICLTIGNNTNYEMFGNNITITTDGCN